MFSSINSILLMNILQRKTLAGWLVRQSSAALDPGPPLPGPRVGLYIEDSLSYI